MIESRTQLYFLLLLRFLALQYLLLNETSVGISRVWLQVLYPQRTRFKQTFCAVNLSNFWRTQSLT